MDSASAQASFMTSQAENDINGANGGPVFLADTAHLAKIARNQVLKGCVELPEGYFTLQSLNVLTLLGYKELLGDKIRPRDSCPKDKQEHVALERLCTILDADNKALEKTTVAITRYSTSVADKGRRNTELQNAVGMAIDGDGVTHLVIRTEKTNEYSLILVPKKFQRTAFGGYYYRKNDYPLPDIKISGQRSKHLLFLRK